MRLGLSVALLLAPALGACRPIPTWRETGMAVAGTADFSSSPRDAAASRDPAASGAVPLEVLYCESSFGPTVRGAVVRFGRGEGCVVDLLHPGGTCDLPTTGAPVRVAVRSASTAFAIAYFQGAPSTHGRSVIVAAEPPLNVVVGGDTVDGSRYVTYRFTGGDVAAHTREECERLLPPSARPPHPRTSGEVTENEWSAWKSGALCTAQGCAH